MLFKPDLNETAKAAGDSVARVASSARRRTVSIAITLLIVGGLGYIGWTTWQQKQGTNRAGGASGSSGAGAGGNAAHPGRAGLSRRRRFGPRPQYRDGALAGRRQTDLGQFHGRAGRQEGRRARRDRSRALQGGSSIRPSPRRRRTRRCSPTSASTSSATSSLPFPTPAPSSRPTPSARWSPSRKRW